MSPSDRSSGRAAEESRKDLVNSVQATNNGADGGIRPGPSSRVGGRRLVDVRASLSDRDFAVLHAVAELHFATTRQLERLRFQTQDTTPLAAARSARRTLARLHNLRLLDRLNRRIGGVRAGSAAFVWRLAPAGARLLGDINRRRSREPSLAHLDHVLEVAELVVHLHEQVRTPHVGVQAVDVQTEPACWRPFVGHHGARVLLKPDLRLTITTGDHELHWFVELDRGTEHRPALTRKLHAYLAAWRDGGEQARAGVFPRVLWVTPDDQRARAITRVWRSVSGVPDGMFWTATAGQTIDVLTDAGGRS